MEEKNQTDNQGLEVLRVRYTEENPVVYFNDTMSEEDLLVAYAMLTHALVVALTLKGEEEFGGIDEAMAVAWRKVDLAADTAHKCAVDLAEGMEVVK